MVSFGNLIWTLKSNRQICSIASRRQVIASLLYRSYIWTKSNAHARVPTCISIHLAYELSWNWVQEEPSGVKRAQVEKDSVYIDREIWSEREREKFRARVSKRGGENFKQFPGVKTSIVNFSQTWCYLYIPVYSCKLV